MSNATTTTQAVTEMLGDLERLHPEPEAYTKAVEQAVQEIAMHHQVRARKLEAMKASFIESKKSEFTAHVKAETEAITRRKE